MNLLTSLKWDCIQPSDGSGSRSVRVNDEFPDESEVIASSRSGINVFDLFGDILDGADLRQFLKDHHVDATQYKALGRHFINQKIFIYFHIRIIHLFY